MHGLLFASMARGIATPAGLNWIKPNYLANYYEERAMQNTVSQDPGATIAEAVAVLEKYGAMPEADDPYTPEDYYVDTLGELEDYDQKNQTDYLFTLKSYLDNNKSVQEVAKETFVHRNTINYKINKIKEILNCDLDYQNGLRLLLAFKVKELL